jgi:competence protein ComEA
VQGARRAAATVHVAGAVRRPGVYRMRPGARVDDAVRQAGGGTARADLGAVNLAAKVEDGRQVLVPERAPRAAAPGGGAVAGGGGAASATAAPGQPLNLNTATLEQLDTLAGVGPATAQKILDFRDEHGGFGSVDELAQVPGIGDKRLASLRDQVRV